MPTISQNVVFHFIIVVFFVNQFVVNATPTNDDDDNTFCTNDYFNVTDKPVLGNGHIAYIPFGDSIYMNGLYNGQNDNTHRARIPNYANIYIENCGSFTLDLNKLDCAYELSVQQAVFRTIKSYFDDMTNNITVEHIQYAHRFFDSAIVNTIYVKRNEATRSEGMLSIGLTNNSYFHLFTFFRPQSKQILYKFPRNFDRTKFIRFPFFLCRF